MVTDEAHFVQGHVFNLPWDRTLADVSSAIAHVVSRYDVLRTLFHFDGDQLCQVVEGDGELKVPVYSVCADGERSVWDVAWAEAKALSGEFSAAAFAHEKEWPARFAVIEVDGKPSLLVFAFDQIAVDGHGAETLIKDLLSTCAGESEIPAPGWQPVDEAEFEQSAQGRAIAARAGGYWRDVLASSPATIFDFPVLPPSEPRHYFYELRSAAIKVALAAIREKKRFSASAVILASMAVALSQYTGHERIVMRLVSGNRVGRERKTMVGTLITEGTLALDVAGLSFDEIAVAAFRASGKGNQFAFCDPGLVGEIRQEQRLGHGAHIDLGACFSDVQGGFADSRTRGADEPEVDEAYLRELARETTVQDSPGGSGVHGLRFFMSAVEAGHLMLLRLSADTCYVPRESMRQVLTGIERLLLAAATSELAAADLAAVTGIVPAARGEDWVRCADGWVDLAATRQLWAQVAGGRPAGVLAEPAPDGARLVGYLAGPAEPDFGALHREMVQALAERSDVRAPDVYRHTAGAPDSEGGAGAWRSLTVLTQTDGR